MKPAQTIEHDVSEITSRFDAFLAARLASVFYELHLWLPPWIAD